MVRTFSIYRLSWYCRWPLKAVLLALTVMLVCFPYPTQMIRHMKRWRHPNALIEPAAPLLQPWINELEPQLAQKLQPKVALKRVERFVYDHLPYAYDWQTWGSADYIPTVTEAITMGREDCDGRAVVAASILTHFGYKAQLVTDFTHVWVKTKQGETMGPRKNKAVVATDQGIRVQPGAWRQLFASTSTGMAVFPLPRQLIVIGMLWLLSVRRRSGIWIALLAAGLMVDGLLMMRGAGVVKEGMTETLLLGGIGSILLGVLALWISSTRTKTDRPREQLE